MWTTLLAESSKTFWLPEKASTVAPSVDGVFYFVYWLTVFFVVTITAAMLYLVFKYRHRGTAHPYQPVAGHSTALELTWTIVPTIIVLIIFYYGFRGYLNMAVEPPDPYEIHVTGQKWSWSFRYPNGHVDNELHVPVNQPVRLVLESPDVIHSLFIPEFRVKKDVVPGRFNRFWFEATKITPKNAPYDVYCTEYCGQNHSTMVTKAYVHDPDDFRKWLEEASNWVGRRAPIEVGQELVQRRGCLQCHSLTGVAGTGPTLKDLYGSQRPTNAGTVLADDAYIKESILDPHVKLVNGFGPIMPSYRGQFKDHDLDAVVWYLKSISANFKGDLAPGRSVGAATTQATTQPATGPRQ